MLRFHLLFALLFAANISYARPMNETEKAYCKENPYKCSSYGHREEPPGKPKEEKRKSAPSGPEWQLVEGENKNIIISYFVQLVRATAFSNCILQGGALIPTINPNAIQDRDYFLVIAMTQEKSITLEQHKYSVTPLFRLSGAYISPAPNDHTVPINEALPADLKDQPLQYELLISTTADRTRLQSVKHNKFYLRYSKVYTGDMTKAQSVVSLSKVIAQNHECNAQ